MRSIVLAALIFLNTSSGFAAVVSNFGGLRAISIQNTVQVRDGGTRRSLNREIIRAARPACERLAQAEIRSLGGQPVETLKFVTNRIVEGDVRCIADSSFETDTCSTPNAQVTCTTTMLVGHE